MYLDNSDLIEHRTVVFLFSAANLAIHQPANSIEGRSKLALLKGSAKGNESRD